ncbi:EAL domain-containing protein [Candidatus Sulfurimonas marisnigri]|uniref:EAL domain-containing protein n=1 Tax=Candidatus Sulfurimonas marisnigri TaxID=2740405 RepID=A0A7S7LYR0_9BACT|nr:EAL domain-containing protein [Candidatus Sulfurimonas marisnigri]QOY53750.1 EAL domain-containing protein [Candidatus Sulfurimonas marisnigri]
MSLNKYQIVTVEAVKRVYLNSQIGIFGHFAVVILMALIFMNKIPQSVIFFGVAVHMIILTRRIMLTFKFNKIKDEPFSYIDIKKWMFIYTRCMFFSGAAFGLTLFFLENLEVEYHFFILSMLVALAAGAILTIGEVFTIYISYLAGMLVVTFIWMLLHAEHIYNMGALLIFGVFFYLVSTSRRYADNFREIVLEKNRAKEHICEQEKAQEEIIEQKCILDYQAKHDSLTDLPNRALFNDRLKLGIQKAKRNGTILALYFIDLDNFKIVNDSLGHEMGDKVLKEVTLKLKSIMRINDTLARWGGDEFTVILEDLKNSAAASTLAQKIIKVLTEPLVISGHTLYVTCSIGISLYPQDGKNSEDLIKYADSAMYKAKNEGKNNIQFYSDDMTKLALERVVMESSLRSAINNEEFVVYYQPQIDATNDKLTGMEALVRWNHPINGLVSPFKFIPLAEETGMIVEIDNIVMNIAMKQFRIWKDEGYNPGLLSLNLSMKHLEQQNYIKHLKASMQMYSIDAQELELELTESDIMKRPEEAIVKLKEISDLGVRIAIDDFGTGYSSLSYLKKLPINKLKIDKSFVDDIPDDEDGKAIVRAVIALTHSLNLELIAEGVEEESQKDFLLENGCNNIQGYYYSKPISFVNIQEYMKDKMR